MRRLGIAALVLGLLVLLTGAKASKHRLDDRWLASDLGPRAFQKLVIIGITDDPEARRTFENLFVSHLRGRGIEGVTSRSIVPDFSLVADGQHEERIVGAIESQKIDGAISVRVVPLGGRGEQDWGAAWREAAEQDGDLRELIAESLPFPDNASGPYGVEVALWETESWDRIWAARTNGYSRKQLRKNRANFTQMVMNALKMDDLLGPTRPE